MVKKERESSAKPPVKAESDSSATNPPEPAAKSHRARPVSIASKPASKAATAKKASGFPIVGIGASAGGLEAFEQFFINLPPQTGMAFIIVQHLDPTGHSLMPEILTRFTKMPVHVVADNLSIEPDSIYLIPPNKDMGIDGGKLFLQAITTKPPGIKLPVDFFFRSLAQAKGPEAIGIILSGTGTDGTLGVRAIKAELGTIFVQDPASAKYDGMPRSAIGTGLADFVLKPAAIPQKLVQFVQHAVSEPPPVPTAEKDSREPLQQVFAALRSQTGHDFSRYKKTTIQRRIQRRMGVNQIENIAAYARFLKDHDDEVKALLKDLLISVTNFFRDPEAFAELKKDLKRLLAEREPDSEVRAWVAGCATGEEAYSIAMVIAECMDELNRVFRVQVFGTDIDLDALRAARTGLYPANIASDVTPAQLKRFFVGENGAFRIKKELREMVVFAPQNLIKDPPFSRMDLICCRNVLIYLEGELQKRIMPLLHYALKPSGILFLGPSETVGDSADLFSVLNTKWKILKRREAVVIPGRMSFPAAFTPGVPRQAVETAPPAAPPAKVPDLAERVFLDKYAPTFAVIDEKYRLVYVRGRTGKYLEIGSGQPSLSVLDMAREGLRTELASLIYRAASEKKMVTAPAVPVKHDGGIQAVNLSAAPLSEPGLPDGLTIIIFQDTAVPAKKLKLGSGSAAKHLSGLEEELRLTKASLQASVEDLEATNEELKSANEELQSNNEEMQSSNEELNTSQEELQSINEELTTLNAELQNNNESLTTANNDLNNFLNRTDIAILFLDDEFRIRKYTPAASDIYKIRDIDVGRPLDEVASRLVYTDVADDAREVLRALTPKEVEVQRTDKHWFNMRILPYRTVQNAVSGVVVSFLDIDKQKKSAQAVYAVNEKLKKALEQEKRSAAKLRLLATVVSDSNDAIITYDLKGAILTWNRGAEVMYGYSEAEALKMSIEELVPERELKIWRKLIDDIRGGKDVPSAEVKRAKKGGGVIDVWLTATRLSDDKGAFVGTASTERDVTERKAAEHLKDEFIGMVSHELKTPLTVIIGALSVAQKDGVPEATRRELFQDAVTHAGFMSGIVENLLELSRKQSRRLDLHRQPTNIGNICQGVVDQLRIRSTGHQLTCRLPENLPKAEVDPIRVERILYNLVENAIKYSPRGGEVKVTAAEKDGFVTVSVSDQGIGIAPKDQSRLFKSFERLGADVKGAVKGTGLGLNVSRILVEEHGGKIWVDSEPGKGSTFHFTLPIVNNESPSS